MPLPTHETSITFTSKLTLTSALYGPFCLVFAGGTLIWLSYLHPSTSITTLLFKPLWVISPFLILLVGVWGMISAVASKILHLPNLTLSPEGIKLECFLSKRNLSWGELGGFEYRAGKNIQARILKGKYVKIEKLIIPDLGLDKKKIFRELSKWQSR